jgi:4-hydroxybenzoate polyprenyltransferase
LSTQLSRRLAAKFRTHLVLGRVSNLPTVWSNCLAAWVLAAGTLVPTLFVMTVGISLIYIGGMYLNDALDAPWDVEHKRDRPIPRGEVAQPTVLILSVFYLVAGLVAVFGEGWPAFLVAFALVALVIVYNFVHKKISWSPLLIAPARGLLYITVGLAAILGLNESVVVWAILLTLYVVGLSYVAKVEETNVFKRYAPLLLMLLPAAWVIYRERDPLSIAFSVLFLAWLGYAFFFIFAPRVRNLKRSVSAMLAGICLVDLLAVTQTDQGWPWQAACLALFALALLFQRFIPAT